MYTVFYYDTPESTPNMIVVIPNMYGWDNLVEYVESKQLALEQLPDFDDCCQMKTLNPHPMCGNKSPLIYELSGSHPEYHDCTFNEIVDATF